MFLEKSLHSSKNYWLCRSAMPKIDVSSVFRCFSSPRVLPALHLFHGKRGIPTGFPERGSLKLGIMKTVEINQQNSKTYPGEGEASGNIRPETLVDCKIHAELVKME